MAGYEVRSEPMRMNMKRGFTLIELMTVIGILVVLIVALTSAVNSARRRAKIQQAITEASEMTNAILAFENEGKIGEESPLASKVTGDEWKEATEDDLAFILGKESKMNGQKGNISVLYNAAIQNGKILDPRGRPYMFRIMAGTVSHDSKAGSVSDAAFSIPNANRIPADEVN